MTWKRDRTTGTYTSDNGYALCRYRRLWIIKMPVGGWMVWKFRRLADAKREAERHAARNEPQKVEA